MKTALDADLNKELSRCAAGGCGLEEISRLIAQGADPKANGSEALYRAASCGHVECVRLLIQVSEPEALGRGARALLWAAANGQVDLAALLLAAEKPLIATASQGFSSPTPPTHSGRL